MPQRATLRVPTDISATPNAGGERPPTSDVGVSRRAREDREQSWGRGERDGTAAGGGGGRRTRARRRRRRSSKGRKRKEKKSAGYLPKWGRGGCPGAPAGQEESAFLPRSFPPIYRSEEECFLNGELSKARVRHLIPG